MNTQSLLPIAILVAIGLPLSLLVAYGLCRTRPPTQRAAYVSAFRRGLWLPLIGFLVPMPILAVVSLFYPNPGIDSNLSGVLLGLLTGVLVGVTAFSRLEPRFPNDGSNLEETRP